ncbi:transposase [Erwinia rhapontici]|nr:transposase [Erwinia rhapontici]
MRSAFWLIRTVREKHTCRSCDCIVQAAAPSRPLECGIARPSLLARMSTSKYAEHTPLYCQSEIYASQDLELSRSVLSGWLDACCRLLSPLEEALQLTANCMRMHMHMHMHMHMSSLISCIAIVV